MKLLIIDDETISRRVLTKKLEFLGECIQESQSRNGLDTFEKAQADGKPFDLITLDVSMPDMDGTQVLAHIRKREKRLNIPRENRVKVIMVTARMNMSTIKRCIRLGCNGYLLKPVSRFQLLETLGKLGFEIPDNLSESGTAQHAAIVAEIIERFYGNRIELPVFPHVVQEVQEMMQSPDISLDSLEAIVKKDLVIATRVIRAANSSFYAGVSPAGTLSEALVRLGLKASQGIISALAARYLFDADNAALKTQLHTLWMHSYATGCLARQLGQLPEIREKVNPENLFLMGITHDIGKMLLMKAYADIAPEKPISDPELQTAIHEIHTTFGAALLKRLRFSPAMIQTAEFHHWDLFATDTDPELMILNLANRLAYHIGYGYMPMDDPPTNEAISALPAISQLGLTPDAVLDIGKTTAPIIKESAGALEPH